MVGVRPKAVLIDGAVVQTTNQSFDFNGESDLDLQYAMALTNPQQITLLQTGDLVEGATNMWIYIMDVTLDCTSSSTGAGFDNWLDAVDGSFCTFEGGDDPTQVLLNSPIKLLKRNLPNANIGWYLPRSASGRVQRCAFLET